MVKEYMNNIIHMTLPRQRPEVGLWKWTSVGRIATCESL